MYTNNPVVHVIIVNNHVVIGHECDPSADYDCSGCLSYEYPDIDCRMVEAGRYYVIGASGHVMAELEARR